MVNQKRVYQVFCGRWEQANVLDHKGKVLERLLAFNWSLLRDRLQLTHIYLLGLWDTTGPIVVGEEAGTDIRSYPNRCPSPFAIVNHTKVNPLLGSRKDLLALIKLLQGLNLAVLVDFVPNHTGIAHPWVTKHPEYFKRNNVGGAPQTAFSGDVVELDYTQVAVQQQMLEVVKKLSRLGINGVRCDMAHLIPISFWADTIKTIRRTRKQFEFVAEAYVSNVFDLSPLFGLLDAGFTAVYDEPLYRNLVAYTRGAPLEHVLGHLEFVRQTRPDSWIHYLSNHDDNCPLPQAQIWEWQQRLFELPGWQLIYNGTLQGHVGRLAHHYVEVLPEAETTAEAILGTP